MSFVYKAINKVKRKTREIFFDLQYFLFNATPRSVKNSRGLRIIVYHGIGKTDPTKFNSRFLSVQQFQDHLRALKKNFHLISMEDYRLRKFSDQKLNVLVTFDDGLQNNFTNALPILVEHDVPALFLMTAPCTTSRYLFNDLSDVFSYLGPDSVTINGVNFKKRKIGIHYRYATSQNVLLSHYFHNTNSIERSEIIEQIYKYVSENDFKKHSEFLQLMSEDELRLMAQQKSIEFGCHGTTHCDFSKLSEPELGYELESGKKYLETITGLACDTVAFPYGNYDEKTIKLCKGKNFKYLLGTEKLNTPEDRTFIIERFTVNPFVSAINQMYYISKNNYE